MGWELIREDHSHKNRINLLRQMGGMKEDPLDTISPPKKEGFFVFEKPKFLIKKGIRGLSALSLKPFIIHCKLKCKILNVDFLQIEVTTHLKSIKNKR